MPAFLENYIEMSSAYVTRNRLTFTQQFRIIVLSRWALDRPAIFCIVRTTGEAGGLHWPYKGLIQPCLKTHE